MAKLFSPAPCSLKKKSAQGSVPEGPFVGGRHLVAASFSSLPGRGPRASPDDELVAAPTGGGDSYLLLRRNCNPISRTEVRDAFEGAAALKMCTGQFLYVYFSVPLAPWPFFCQRGLERSEPPGPGKGVGAFCNPFLHH